MAIFDGVRYYLSPSISPDQTTLLYNLLEDHGAVQEELSDASHIVTDSDRFEGWQSIEEDVAVVTVSEGLYL